MKILLSGMTALALATLMMATPTQAAASKSKDKSTPKEGDSYSGSGAVTKNNIDICMVTGLRWALKPDNGEEVKIYPKTKHVTQVLDDAAKNNSKVRVSGTWKKTAECHYVETSKVTAVKE
jgi:hypothetical protein